MENKKLRKAFYISKAQYACLVYLNALTCKSSSEIMEAALNYSLKHISKRKIKPRIPALPTNKMRLDSLINMETIKSLELMRVNEEMFKWRSNDFGRYGLQHILNRYMVLFPEMEKIFRIYGVNEK